MYCSSCGVAVAQGLSYCNYCGAKLNRGDGDGKSSNARPEYLLFAMMATFVFGLVAITVLMGVMKAALDLPVERVLAFTLLPFLLLVLLEGVFIRLLFRRKRDSEETGDRVALKGQATKELTRPGRRRCRNTWRASLRTPRARWSRSTTSEPQSKEFPSWSALTCQRF